MCSTPRRPFVSIVGTLDPDERWPGNFGRIAAVAAILLSSAAPLARAADASPPIDLAAAIARGDLDFTSPATRSDEGMPVGNGRMGSLVWTTPSAVKFQINRCDVFSSDGSSVSF